MATGKKKAVKKTKETIKKIEKNIYQRGDFSFQVKMQIGGYAVNETFDYLHEAQAYRDLKRAEAALDHSEGQIYQAREKKRVSRSYTFGQAIKKYRTDISEKKKGSDSEGNRLDRLSRLPIAEIPMSMIGRDILLALFKDLRSGVGQQHKRATEEEKKAALKRSRSRKKMDKEPQDDKAPLFHPPRPVTEGTVKRYYNLVHHIIEVAVNDWKKLDKNPCNELKKGDIPKDNKRRDRRLVGNEYEQLLEQLTGEARTILILACETAMRRQEFLGLEWQAIKFKGRTGIADLSDSKTGERLVPLSARAVDALKAMQKEDNVVKLKGKVFKIGPMGLRYQWRKAREAIGAPDLRIHDLRHQSASVALEKGLTIAELQLLTGHKSIKSLEIYLQAQGVEDVAKKLGALKGRNK